MECGWVELSELCSFLTLNALSGFHLIVQEISVPQTCVTLGWLLCRRGQGTLQPLWMSQGCCLLRTWEDKGCLCSGGAITCRMRPWNLSSSTAWQPQPKSHPPKLNPNGPQEFCAVTTSVFSFCTKDNNKYWWEEEAHFTHIWARGYFYCFYNKHKYISMHSQTCTF